MPAYPWIPSGVYGPPQEVLQCKTVRIKATILLGFLWQASPLVHMQILALALIFRKRSGYSEGDCWAKTLPTLDKTGWGLRFLFSQLPALPESKHTLALLFERLLRSRLTYKCTQIPPRLKTAKFVSEERIACCLQKLQMTRSTSEASTDSALGLTKWVRPSWTQHFPHPDSSEQCDFACTFRKKALYNEVTVKYYHMMVVCMPLVGERAFGTHLVAAGIFSPVLLLYSKFCWRAGQHLWDCPMKWLIPLSAGITVWNYMVAGETPSELIKASPHQREASRKPHWTLRKVLSLPSLLFPRAGSFAFLKA